MMPTVQDKYYWENNESSEGTMVDDQAHIRSKTGAIYRCYVDLLDHFFAAIVFFEAVAAFGDPAPALTL